MAEYLEHEKLRKIQKESQVCGEFLEWLRDVKGIHLASWQGESRDKTLEYVLEKDEILLAEFFEIDLKKLETEKKAIIAEFLASQKQETAP